MKGSSLVLAQGLLDTLKGLVQHAAQEASLDTRSDGELQLCFNLENRHVVIPLGTKDRGSALEVAPDAVWNWLIDSQTAVSLNVRIATEPVPLDAIEELYQNWASLATHPERKGRGPSLETAKKHLSTFRRFRQRHQLDNMDELRELLIDPNRYNHAVELDARARQRNVDMPGESPMERSHRLKANRAISIQGGYRGMLRSCAAIFSQAARNFYAARLGSEIDNPFSVFQTQSVSEEFVSVPDLPGFLASLLADLQAANDTPVILVFLLATAAGCRAQEATHVRWSDIAIDAQNQWNVLIQSNSSHQTKNKRKRRVPISESVAQQLLARRPGDAKATDYIVPTERGARGVPNATRGYGALRRLRALLKASKVPSQRPLHWLRKCFASLTAAYTSEGEERAQRYCGHSDVRTTRRSYLGQIGPRFVEIATGAETKQHTAKRSAMAQRRKAIFDFISEHEDCSTSQVQAALGLSKSTAKRELACLLGEGVLTSSGNARATRYRLSRN